MQKFAIQITQSKYFHISIISVIVAACVLVGVETFPSIYEPYKNIFLFFDHVIQTIFTIEIIVRILTYGSKPYLFFKSALNIFDFIITALFYLPFGGVYVAVFRLVRILRVFRLVTALTRLQVLVGALIKSIPSIGYVGLLLFMQFYIFAIIGHFQFGKTDPQNFGNLGSAMMTLFEIITLEGWVEIYKRQPNAPIATLYFVSFILIGTMIVLNLFIGVIIDGFDEAKKEVEEASDKTKHYLDEDVIKISDQIDTIKEDLEKIITRIKIDNKKPKT